MAKNRKTVWKAFDYLQCDDFAAYLMQMAAKGWHFREWSTGLIFDRGEPESAVYCVEVFTDGSEYDTCPQPNTLEFAEYCEAAGWKLMDAKRKFCIFKRIRDDAMPILTPRERVENTFRAAGKNLWFQLALFAGMMLTNWGSFLGAGFENRVFSHAQMGILGMVTLIFLLQAVHCILFYCKKHQMMAAVNREEKPMFARIGGIMIYRWLYNCIWIFSLVYLALPGDAAFLLIPISAILISLLAGALIAKFRLDTTTNVVISGGLGVMLAIVIVAVTMSVVFLRIEEPSAVRPPLTFADLGVEAGSMQVGYHDEQENFLGSAMYYSLHHEDEYLSYQVYTTEQRQILDRIWNEREKMAVNEQRTDCTAQWGAEIAFRNGVGDYYVRYDDAVLILGTNEDTVLSQQQIDTVRDRLKLR